VRYVATETVPVGALEPYPGNARVHDEPALDESARTNGQYRSVVARRLEDGTLQLLAGHGTVGAFRRQGAGEVRVEVIEADDTEARRIVLADNASYRNAGYDERLLLDLLDAAAKDGGLEGTGYDEDALRELLDSVPPELGGLDGGALPLPDPAPTLAERFFIPPFDVLNAREGWWQDRKKRWVSLGIKSELGRDARTGGSAFMDPKAMGSNAAENPSRIAAADAAARYSREQESGLTYGSASGRDPTYYAQKQAAEARLGRALTVEEFEAEHYQPSTQYETGTSIFDPVLCELAYRWFSAEGMTVLDPFAGGSVRGLLAGMLGRRYVGNDLRAEQIKANEEQRADFEARALVERGLVEWSVGDSAEWVDTLSPESADLVFTCPPYLWLEKYSDDPADLSNASADDFERLYTKILTGAAGALRPDRFAVVVVGDVRDSKSRLVDFRGMTIRAAEAAGLWFQSGAVLVTQVGSLAVRAGRSFSATRVLGRTHQDVLVFVKGSGSAAAKACGEVDVTDLPDLDDTASEDAA
jgi:ParB-like chromosome segregation protein Spo0J